MSKHKKSKAKRNFEKAQSRAQKKQQMKSGPAEPKARRSQNLLKDISHDMGMVAMAQVEFKNYLINGVGAKMAKLEASLQDQIDKGDTSEDLESRLNATKQVRAKITDLLAQADEISPLLETLATKLGMAESTTDPVEKQLTMLEVSRMFAEARIKWGATQAPLEEVHNQSMMAEGLPMAPNVGQPNLSMAPMDGPVPEVIDLAGAKEVELTEEQARALIQQAQAQGATPPVAPPIMPVPTPIYADSASQSETASTPLEETAQDMLEDPAPSVDEPMPESTTSA